MKHFKCREKSSSNPNGYEYFSIEAQNWEEAQEACDMWNATVISEINE